MLHAINTTD